MNRNEPETKHLSMAELHAYLARIGAWHPVDPERTAMSIAPEVAPVGKPSRGAHVQAPAPAAAVEPADEDEVRTLIFSRVRPQRARRFSPRALLIALGATSALLALLLRARSAQQENPGQVTSPASATAERATSERDATRPETQPVVSPTPPGSDRAAVDLLLSGDSRGALDAYRRLSAAAGAPPAFALAVRLLERELGRCASSGDALEAPCTP